MLHLITLSAYVLLAYHNHRYPVNGKNHFFPFTAGTTLPVQKKFYYERYRLKTYFFKLQYLRKSKMSVLYDRFNSEQLQKHCGELLMFKSLLTVVFNLRQLWIRLWQLSTAKSCILTCFSYRAIIYKIVLESLVPLEPTRKQIRAHTQRLSIIILFFCFGFALLDTGAFSQCRVQW